MPNSPHSPWKLSSGLPRRWAQLATKPTKPEAAHGSLNSSRDRYRSRHRADCCEGETHNLNIHRRMIKALVLLCITTLSIRAEIQLVGIISFENERLYSLRDTTTNDSSGWINLGRSFSGYTLVDFDAKTEALNLKKGGELVSVRMVQSVIAQTRAKPSSEEIAAEKALIIATAKREVLQRDGWEESTILGAENNVNGDDDKQAWHVIVRNPKDKTGAGLRIIIISGDWTVKNYHKATDSPTPAPRVSDRK
jgi:hypothetical protein